MRYLKSIILSGLACILMTHTSFAQTYYVNTDLLNVRNEPISGQVVEQLKRGEAVEVYQKLDSNRWVNISDNPAMPKWVSGSYLCDYEDCYIDDYVYTPTKVFNYDTNHSTGIKKSKKVSQSYNYGGSCPCSGVFNCTGPRGGKYCITSGGNKRYR